MAGIAFSAGQSMIRPGVYNRYVQVASPLYAGASDGIVGCAFSAQWGPLGEVIEITSLKQAISAFGGDGGIFRQIFMGGASTVYAVRAGLGGTAAVCTLMDAAGAAAVEVSARYVGTRGLKYELTAADGGVRYFILREDGAELERIVLVAGGDEAATLIEAGARSEYVIMKRASGYSGGGALAVVTETAMTAGTDPQLDGDDYGEALDRLTAYAWNCVCVDSCAQDVRAGVLAYMKRASADGHMGFGVVGEGVDVDFSLRTAHAIALNDYSMVYVGGGWYEDDVLIDGWRAAARIAGMIARVPASQSLTHRAISGATRCAEALTNAKYVTCTNAGMLTFSPSTAGGVWVENAITSLHTPSGEDDAGWKKIKRARVRFELMDRASATVAPMIGNISNDSDGRAAVIQALQGLLRAMASEGKLMPGGTVTLDPDVSSGGDSAGFIIEADDVDALEKVYFTYRFSFIQN